MTKSGRKINKFSSSLPGAKINPFDVHTNRSKHNILGQKSKDDWGLPGVSRSKAVKKRERTLLNEFKNRHKNNTFLDKRIGENDAFMDPEKKILMRMITEKKKQLSKKSLYVLNDEELFHAGKSLDEFTMKDKSTFSDEDDDDDLLDADFVKDQHFGGDLFTKPNEKDDSGLKNRKDWIDELITESKKKKAETKMEKEVHNSAVTKLDEKFHSFLQAMKGRNMTDEEKEKSKKTCEYHDYDTLVRELSFDRSKRAPAANRLKTEEELAKEEHERLQKLEEERKRRMNGEEGKNMINQKSADALDDGFTYFEKKPLSVEDIINMKRSQDEESAQKGKDQSQHKQSKIVKKEEEELDDVFEEEESEEVEDEEDEVGIETVEEVEDEDEEEEVTEESVDEDSDEEMEISRKDNKITEGKEIIIKKKQNNQEMTEVNPISTEKNKVENFDDEIPFTFDVPNEYDDYWNLMENRTPPQVSIIIERMIKCNHPRLGADNKAKVNNIFAFILQTLQNICTVEPENLRGDYHPFLYFSAMVPHLYTLTQLIPNDCSSALNEVLDEKYEEYSKQKIKRYPYFDTFVFLKVSGLLFPASDLHHAVMTRVITFIAQILYESKVKCSRDIASLLFTSGMAIEYLSQSRRFLGEVSNALNGILYLAISKKALKKNLPITPPFKSFGPFSELLVLSENYQSYNDELPKLKLSLINDVNEDICISDALKLRFISEALILLNKLCSLWAISPAVRQIFLPTTELVQHLPLQSYPASVRDLIENLKMSINKLPNQVPHLRKQETIVKTLKMIDPCIRNLSYKKREEDSALQEKQKLLHKLKKERKAVNRELKKDAHFLARVQLKEVLEKDAVRKRKVNLIMQELGTQEHEFKKFKSKK